MKSFDGLEVNSGLFVTNLTSVITRTMQGYHLSFFPTFVFSRCFFSFHIFSLLNLKAMLSGKWGSRQLGLLPLVEALKGGTWPKDNYCSFLVTIRKAVVSGVLFCVMELLLIVIHVWASLVAGSQQFEY